jgi:hypothetical protein
MLERALGKLPSRDVLHWVSLLWCVVGAGLKPAPTGYPTGFRRYDGKERSELFNQLLAQDSTFI